MFSENKKSKKMVESTSGQNIISQGTKIIGDLISEGDIRIDGTLEGTLKTKGKVAVGRSGFIKGTLEGTEAYIEGKFSGKLNLSGTLTLKASAQVEGEVVVGKLSVDPGANFNVSCVMKGSATNSEKNSESKQK